MINVPFLAQPFLDLDNWMQIIFLFLVIGLPILRLIFRAFTGVAKAARGQRPAGGDQQGGGQQGKGLREFLEEIRREAERAAGGPEAAPKQQPQQAEAPPPEQDVEPVAAEAPVRPRVDPAERRAELRRQAAARRRSRQQRQVREQEEVAQEQPSRSPEPARTVADRHLESALADRHVQSSVQDRQIESSLASRRLQGVRSRFARKGTQRQGRRELDRLPGCLNGMSMKDMMIAQVILGPPRSKNPRRR